MGSVKAMTIDEIMEEIHQRAGEWLDEAGQDAPLLINNILCHMLIKEREMELYYKNYIKSQEEEIKKLRKFRDENVSFNTKH